MTDDDPSSPIILVLPGGGYETHSEHEAEPIAEWIRSLGWRARIIRYPLKSRHPAPLNFVQKEIIAERDAGANIIGIIGFSAGGHLAGHAALAPDVSASARPDFAILGYPVVSMVTRTHEICRANLIGLDASDELRRATSLELLVTPTAGPFFIWSTVEDDAVPVAEHSYLLGAALAAAGVPHDLHLFERGEHGVGLGVGLAAEAWAELCATWLELRRQ